MRRGKVLQVGNPQELYMNPKDIFVAHFIGESNFLEGYVSEVKEEKESVIELRQGLFLRALGKGHKAGEKVAIAVRPEALEIKKDKMRKPNSLLGEVERVQFEGTNIRYEIRLENGDPIVVVRQSLLTEWFSEGEKVTVGFPVERIFVFPYPKRGLREELALE